MRPILLAILLALSGCATLGTVDESKARPKPNPKPKPRPAQVETWRG